MNTRRASLQLAGVATLALLFASCKKDDPAPATPPATPVEKQYVLITRNASGASGFDSVYSEVPQGAVKIPRKPALLLLARYRAAWHTKT